MNTFTTVRLQCTIYTLTLISRNNDVRQCSVTVLIHTRIAQIRCYIYISYMCIIENQITPASYITSSLPAGSSIIVVAYNALRIWYRYTILCIRTGFVDFTTQRFVGLFVELSRLALCTDVPFWKPHYPCRAVSSTRTSRPCLTILMIYPFHTDEMQIMHVVIWYL